MQDIFKYIDVHLNESVAELTELCKLPSVSAQKQAIPETAEHVVGMLRPLGFETRVLPKTGGGPTAQPVVFAELRGKSPKTLLFYDHYDVQPPEPLELWTSPPFQPTLRDGKLYGRGVSDNKGNIAARLAAIRAWREVRGELPCRLKFCIEGDEEIGSPLMEEFVEEHRELLAADACIWEGGGVTWEGVPQVTLGVKGLLYVELESNTINRDAHSSYGTVLPNAAWRLGWALSTIKGADERVRVEGFYDAVRPPTPEEHATIDGLSSGYEGEGPKTVLPARAVAKMDFRLVPDQDPQDILEKLQRYLEREGFGDVEVRYLSGERPARTPVTDPFVQVVRDAAR